MLQPLQIVFRLDQAFYSWLKNGSMPVKTLVEPLCLLDGLQLVLNIRVGLSYVIHEGVSIAHVNAPSCDAFAPKYFAWVFRHF